jgi:D-aminopeptidase
VVDFRYHALSLIAVFLALGAGLLVGVAVGDSGLASSAREALRDGLRGDVERMRGEIGRRDRFEERVLPAMLAGRLRGVRVRVVSSDDAVVDEAREAVEAAGGSVSVAPAEGRTSSIEGVGVELSTTEPSAVGGFRSSVDNIDEPAGKVSLVLLLAGEAEGAYGKKPGAADIVPDTGP